MKSKVLATASIKREDGKSILTLELESPFHAYIKDGNSVLVQLSMLNGTNIDFLEYKEPKIKVTTVEEMSEGGDAAKEIWKSSEPVTPVAAVEEEPIAPVEEPVMSIEEESAPAEEEPKAE